MTNEAKIMMAAIDVPPTPYLIAESKITDPIGANTYYSAITVIGLLAAAREKCAKVCEEYADEMKAADEDAVAWTLRDLAARVRRRAIPRDIKAKG